MGAEHGHPVIDLSHVPHAVIDEFALDRLPRDRPRRPTSELLRLDGRVAVVTGGGGDGLGNATCHRLAEQGAIVAVVDVNEGAGRQTAVDLAANQATTAEAFVGNVADWDDAHRVIEKIMKRFGSIDLLVNNAGGSGAVGRFGNGLRAGGDFASVDRSDLDTIVDVNFRGVLNMTKAALDPMLAAKGGRIVNVASEGGKQGMSGLVAYNSSKSAVIGFTRNLAHEIGPRGVSVVAVCPGIMVTERLLMGGHFQRVGPLADGWHRTTIGRCSIPDEVASMIAFLASDAGAYVHGTAVSVGGGMADD